MDEQSTERNTLVRKSSRLSLLTLASRVLGLVREMVKGAFLGTSDLSDAWGVAFIIPNFLRRLFAEGSIAVAFVPTFKGYLVEGDNTATREFLSSVFTVLTFLVTAVVTGGILLAPLIVPLFGPPGGETTLLTRIMFPYLVFISLAALLQGILNGVGVFSPSGFTPVLFNVIIIGSTFLLSPRMENPARAMAIGVTAGGAAQLLFQLPFVLKSGFRFGFTGLVRAFRNPGTRTVLRLIGPTVIGMAAYQLNELVSTALAGNAGTGVLSSLSYSLRLQEVILGIFAVSIGTVMLPQLSGYARTEDWERFNGSLAGAMKAIALITIPVTFFSIVQAEHIVAFIFKVRNFTDESVALTAYAFRFHALGQFFIALNRIVSPAFYARKNTKSPTTAGIIAFGINILLAFLLVGPMKGGGIALALSIASLANTLILLAMLTRGGQVRSTLVVRSTMLYALKIAAFSLLAVLPVRLVREPLYGAFAGAGSRLVAEGVPLMISTVIFAAIGLVCLTVSRDAQLRTLLSMIRRKRG
jgi:putative peptidoglycan lipid II flippase